mmetsp:Transcript_36093/g.73582  ORF Transcript_36093/g.73582 Transcript_36093/m.73582 type:complete len:1022 (-) Transcript_36093:24-3089(-)
MQTSQEDIERACTAFQKRVHKLIKFYSTRNQYADPERLSIATKEAQRCVRHANHVLCTLSSKLRSLEHALTAFGELSANDYITAFSSSIHNKQSQERTLHQWFANYLRIRDGFVLFESGERRHKHDVDEQMKRDFPSRLQTKPKYSDNTQTFSSKLGYTGYGMDEFNDEVVGIRKRLLDQMIIIKGGSSTSNVARNKIWDKILDDDMGIMELWNMYFDEIVAVSGSLREKLTSTQSRFVSEINQHIQTHWRQRSSIGTLKLVADDKAERISFDSLDVCREGNNFTLLDKGGSLPIGMSVMDWKKKFRPTQQQQQQKQSSQPQQGQRQQNQVNKKRRRIVAESSSDEDSDDDIPFKKKSSTTVINGLVIRERREVTTSSGAETNKKTSSLDEIKRQAGISATQLEQGFDQLEGEEFKSTMAANEDDVKEGFLVDFGNPSTASASSSSSGNNKSCPHLVLAVTQFQLLRKNNEYQNRYLCDHDAEDLWKDFLILATERWKEAINVLLKVRKDISLGALKKSSDEAYDARERCREVNMLLGIHCLDIHDFLSGEVSSLARPSTLRNGTSMSLSPFNALLSQTDHCFLLAAEEAFKNALILVMEQEDCQKSLPDSITNRFVKGQHFLLRGRAQHNIGQAFVEQSQCKFLVGEGNRKLKQRLLKQASKEFADSLNSANLCRGNTTAIYGHVDAELIDSDSDCTWTSSAMRQSFEAFKLVSLTSRSYGICLWELGEMEKAENTFCGTADLSDYLNFMGDEHISNEEVVDALRDPYWCAMTLAEFATRSLEDIPIRGGNEKKGNGILRMVKLALQQARLVSDKIFALAREHSIENMTNVISTREEIDAEEKSICDMWEKKKVSSKKNIYPQSSLQNVAMTALPRRDIGGLAHSALAADAPRKIFIRDGGTSSSSLRSRTYRKGKRNEEERQAASENFHDAFGVEDSNPNFDGDGFALSGLDPTQPSSQHHGKYLKWGDELLEEHERNAYPACCPPLPPNIPLNIKMAITSKLGDILPSDDKLVAKLYT